MFDAFLRFLILICVVVACYFLAVWVFGMLGIALPLMFERVMGVIGVLIIILVGWRMFGGALVSGPWFPPRNPPTV